MICATVIGMTWRRPLIARVVRGQLAQQPAPRFSRQLGAWRQALQSLFRRR